MNSNQQDSIFKWKNLCIRQKDEVFKVGTDAVLLGAWIPTKLKEASNILDVGTGTGILALKMSEAYPASVVEGIDHDENAVCLALHNFKLTDSADRLSSRLENIFEFKKSKGGEYDLIVCNPPYYFGQYKGEKNSSLKARHADHSVSEWMKALSARIKKSGHIFLVLPYEITFDWIRSANTLKLYIQNRLDVFSFAGDPFPKRSLIHLSDSLVKPGLEKLSLYHEDKYTTDYLAFSGINAADVYNSGEVD